MPPGGLVSVTGIPLDPISDPINAWAKRLLFLATGEHIPPVHTSSRSDGLCKPQTPRHDKFPAYFI
jgi:hypothetical protein